MTLRQKTLMLLGLTLLVSSCTIVPKPVVPSNPSYDGTTRNSGFIGYAPDGRGIITVHKAEEYNGLIVLYGTRFIPPLKNNDGLVSTSTNTVLIDQEHLGDFRMMLYWKLNLR